MSHWSSGLPICFPSEGTRVQIPWGVTITKPSCRQCDNPTWSLTAFLSRFHARCRSPFWLHNQRSRLLGEALWRACNLTSFSPCLTALPVCFPSQGSQVPYLCTYLFTVLPVLLCLSRSSYSVLHVLFCLSCSAYPVLPVLFCLSISACPVLGVMFMLCCSACPVLPVLFWLVLAVLQIVRRPKKSACPALVNLYSYIEK